MENDMIKLNILLHKERGTEHELEQGNVLMENEFIGGLRVSTSYLQLQLCFSTWINMN